LQTERGASAAPSRIAVRRIPFSDQCPQLVEADIGMLSA